MLLIMDKKSSDMIMDSFNIFSHYRVISIRNKSPVSYQKLKNTYEKSACMKWWVFDWYNLWQSPVLKKAFDTFSQGSTYITPDVVGSIFRMMGTAFTEETLQETIAEIDEDGSGQIEFEEFTILAAKFIVEEDDEDVQKELKEAFRLYDKDGM